MTHPTSDDLMRYALNYPGLMRELVAHVADCASCDAEVGRLRAATSLLRSHGIGAIDGTPACMGDDDVAALAAGDLTADERAPLVAHLASCPHCRKRVASVSRALADAAVAREIAAAGAGDTRNRIQRRVLVPAGLAAAAVLLFAVLPRSGDDGEAPHRASAITAAAAPALTSPVGTVADAQILRWAAVAGADRYRVILFGADGRVLYETHVTDTVAALPDSVGLAPGRVYLWKVEARTGWDRWSASELVEFSITRGAPR